MKSLKILLPSLIPGFVRGVQVPPTARLHLNIGVNKGNLFKHKHSRCWVDAGGNIVKGPVYNELTPVLRSVIPDLYYIYTIVMKMIISIQNVNIIKHFH